MKRRTVMVLTTILALLLATIPANAATLKGENTLKSGESVESNVFLHTNLEDVINTLPEGYHDNFDGTQNQFFCRADGWAADPDDRSLDLNVKIFSDGIEIAQTVADTFRQDLADAGVCFDGTCSFSVDLWNLIAPNVEHVIMVQVQDAQTGEWVNAFDTPKTLNCSEQNFLPVGYHDAWEGTQSQFFCLAEGWVVDPNDPAVDLTVRIFSDGVEVAQATAGDYRPDLEEGNACPGGTCSFRVDLAGLISPNANHSIMVQAQDAKTGEWVDLNDTPKILYCIDPGAQPIISDGFGNPDNFAIEALEVFNGQIYAEATNYVQGATIWRLVDGAWTQVSAPGFDSAYGANNPIVFDMFTFKGQLYAGTGNWVATSSAGQIWRSANGTDWNIIAANGLGNPANAGFTTFADFQGMIYAASLNRDEGAEVWRSSTGNSDSWELVASNGFGSGSAYFVITSLNTFKGQLYASVESTAGTGAQVWRSPDGEDWTLVVDSGFGDSNNYQTGSTVVYRGQLYVTTRNDVTGAQLWRSSDGLTWEQVVGNGFGDVNNVKIESITSSAGALYAVANNPVTGVELWRSTDGINWSQINADGFGDSGIFVSLWSNGTVVFDGKYLIGSSGPYGGVIWQLP